ncbi:MAG: DNRLRE domain-containing protein, partial [Clostridiaceae bacterium]|nr:DNRLRE domain-containing protein [Clostridiaceae bacterium]
GTQIVFAPVDFNIPGGFLTEPPLVPETITIEVKEDAFICSAKWDTNFGKEKTLEIKKQEKKENNIRKVYLKFDLTDLQISSVQNAKLKLYSTAADSVDIAVYETSNNWTETTITWNNAPAFGVKITSATASKQYSEWDITQYIRSQLQAGNKIISIGMYVDDDYSGNSSNKKFNSREAEDNHPLLEITAVMGDPGYSSDELIVDNDNANNEGKGTCYFSDEWVSSTSVAGQYYLNDYAHDGNAGADPSKWAKWVPIIPESGEYYVYMMWSSHPNRPDNAPVEIKWANGLDTSISVNQQKNGGEWVYLGEYYLTKGEDCYVKILASDEGYTIADAVKFVRVSPDVQNIDLKDGVGSNRVYTSSGGINLYVSGEVITYQLKLTNRKDLENVKLELEFVSDKENLRFITYRPDVSSYCYLRAENGMKYEETTAPAVINNTLNISGYWYDPSVPGVKVLRAGEPLQLIYKIRVAAKDRQKDIARLTNIIRLTYDGENGERITIIKKLPVNVYMSLPGLS